MSRVMMIFIHSLTWALIISIQIINELVFGQAADRLYQLSLILLFAISHICVFYIFYSFLGKLLRKAPIKFFLIGICVCYITPNLFTWIFLNQLLQTFESFQGAKWTISNSFYFMTDGVVTGIVGTIGYLANQGLKNRETELLIIKEKTEQELLALKSKVNPHFLFNTLNSIYYLTRRKKPEAEEAILLLSENMRYMLEASNHHKVSLNTELVAAEKLLALIRLRVSSQFEIQLKTELSSKREIIPTILLNLIENALKHGDMSDDGYIHVDVSTINGVSISCKNAISTNLKTIASEPNKFGLKSLKRQLELVYPNKHELSIHQTSSTFEVSIKIIS